VIEGISVFSQHPYLRLKPSGETERLQALETDGLFNLGFFMQRMLAIKRAILAQLKFRLGILAIFLGCIVFALAFSALHSNYFNRRFLSHSGPLE
jgi:uncharacterized membrane protein